QKSCVSIVCFSTSASRIAVTRCVGTSRVWEDRLLANDGAWMPLFGGTPVSYDEWTFAAMTYDGGWIKSYLDGKLDNRPGLNPYAYPEGIFDGGENGSDFTVGAVHRSGEMGNFFVGQLGGLAVFNRTLSEK